MKSFWKYTLASFTAFVVLILICFIIMVGIISSAISSTQKEVVIQQNSMLQLRLNSEIVDRAPNDPFQDLDLPMFIGAKKTGLDNIVSAIEKAKTNNNIKGIFLRLDNIPAGYSSVQEIRNALSDFKEETNKFIYAYSEAYTQKAYYLASVADKVFISPEGMLMFSGIAAKPVFFKHALEKIGVEMQVIRHGKFKAAVEPFMRENMSPENREQVETYIGSIWNSVLSEISESRGISIAELNNIADENLLFAPTIESYNKGLVDSVIYEDQVLDFLRSKTGVDKNEGIPIVSVNDMKNAPSKKKHSYTKDKLAVIYASGEINFASSSGDANINGRDYAKEIRKARTDSTIKAIVLRVNSPGGSSLASELIWREVKLAAETKPVIVSMGDVAASGGYYISCPADMIIADPTTITGSIGVFGVVPNAEELLEDKLGINHDLVKTNELADLPNTNRPLTDNEKAIYQQMVVNVYKTFVNHVAEGRNMTYEAVDKIGQGRVWTGEDALELGLVDQLGDLSVAIDVAKEKVGLENIRVVSYPEQKDPIEELMNELSGSVKIKMLKSELGENARYYKMLSTVKSANGILTRMPYDFIID